MDRRTFLRGTGAVLALPWLESLAGARSGEVPRRMVAIETNQGILPQEFFPKEEGKDSPVGGWAGAMAFGMPEVVKAEVQGDLPPHAWRHMASCPRQGSRRHE